MKIQLLALVAATIVFTACNQAPEKEVHRIMTERMITLAVAESCTGGTIAARFTALPGASAYFKSGVVTYSNDSKRNILGVSYDSIARHGVVSESIVRQMAEGVRRITGADYAIATTGIAGPTGGTAELPVGSVWIAVAAPNNTQSRLIHASGDRERIIYDAGSEAIKMLTEILKQD